MLQQFTARYFQQAGQVAGLDINVMSTSVRSVTLTDNDLVRGNFGADARDGNRDGDVITDFNAAEDTILFEAGATIRFVEECNGNLFIQLDGDRDSISVLNADRGIVETFRFVDDLFTA